MKQPTYTAARKVEPLSAQAYALGPGILEVEALAEQHCGRVVEGHPEVSFAVLAGQPLSAKKTWNGLHERIAILEQEGIEIPDALPDDAGRIPPDDLLDAAVMALTARHVLEGTGRVLPGDLQVDGLSQGVLIWMPGVCQGVASRNAPHRKLRQAGGIRGRVTHG